MDANFMHCVIIILDNDNSFPNFNLAFVESLWHNTFLTINFRLQLIGVPVSGLEPEFHPVVTHLLPNIVSHRQDADDMHLQVLTCPSFCSCFILYLMLCMTFPFIL